MAKDAAEQQHGEVTNQLEVLKEMAIDYSG